jgi:hypothetical protein
MGNSQFHLRRAVAAFIATLLVLAVPVNAADLQARTAQITSAMSHGRKHKLMSNWHRAILTLGWSDCRSRVALRRKRNFATVRW